MEGERLWVIGPGRVGLALGTLLVRSPDVGRVTFTGRSPAPPDHPLFTGADPPARYSPGLRLPTPAPTAVLVTVPDPEITAVARALSELPLGPDVPVLHVSGSLGLGPLQALREAGLPIGYVHPLAAVADPAGGADRLRGAWFGLGGDPAAVRVGEAVVRAAEGRALHVPTGAEPAYHAAAVTASNYVVVLLAVAERIAVGAGLSPTAARAALVELAIGAARNVGDTGPVDALTGPLTRGDADTVQRHLSRLSGPDRALYSSLGRQALDIARAGGLDDAAFVGLQRLLEGGE